MLISKTSNTVVKLMVAFKKDDQGWRHVSLVREAFLYVIENYNSYSQRKNDLLDKISSIFPTALDQVTNRSIWKSFGIFWATHDGRREVISISELKWVKKYVSDPVIVKKIERLIYKSLLRSSRNDSIRLGYEWTMSNEDINEVVGHVLLDEGLASKRKMQIALEYDLDMSEYARTYYRKLLWDRHYDKAANLSIETPKDIVEEVIIMNIDNNHFRDALDIAKRFLPKRTYLVDEIEEMQDAFTLD